jgi:dipeptidyl aminopeptidase/acylaminoacyl peptidase
MRVRYDGDADRRPERRRQARDTLPTMKWQVPDGRRIACQADDIWVVDADGTRQGRLTTTPAVELGTAWAPDGSKIAFARGDTLA